LRSVSLAAFPSPRLPASLTPARCHGILSSRPQRLRSSVPQCPVELSRLTSGPTLVAAVSRGHGLVDQRAGVGERRGSRTPGRSRQANSEARGGRERLRIRRRPGRTVRPVAGRPVAERAIRHPHVGRPAGAMGSRRWKACAPPRNPLTEARCCATLPAAVGTPSAHFLVDPLGNPRVSRRSLAFGPRDETVQAMSGRGGATRSHGTGKV